MKKTSDISEREQVTFDDVGDRFVVGQQLDFYCSGSLKHFSTLS
jgi:hypothetical protein